MRKLVVFLLVVSLCLAPAAFANDPGSCPPLGSSLGQPYDFIANGHPYSDSCWYKTNIQYADGSTADDCGYYRARWIFLAGSAALSQRFLIPTTFGSAVTGFKLFYVLDFHDPTANGNDNAITADVTDITTGTWLGGNFYSGWSGTVACSSRIGYASSTYDLRGHTIELKFTTRKANNSNVWINVKYVSLLQN